MQRFFGSWWATAAAAVLSLSLVGFGWVMTYSTPPDWLIDTVLGLSCLGVLIAIGLFLVGVIAAMRRSTPSPDMRINLAISYLRENYRQTVNGITDIGSMLVEKAGEGSLTVWGSLYDGVRLSRKSVGHRIVISNDFWDDHMLSAYVYANDLHEINAVHEETQKMVALQFSGSSRSYTNLYVNRQQLESLFPPKSFFAKTKEYLSAKFSFAPK